MSEWLSALVVGEKNGEGTAAAAVVDAAVVVGGGAGVVCWATIVVAAECNGTVRHKWIFECEEAYFIGF